MRHVPELANLIKTLIRADPDITWHQIVDALWIASLKPFSSSSPDIAPPSPKDSTNKDKSELPGLPPAEGNLRSKDGGSSEENRFDAFVNQPARESTSSQTVPAAVFQSPTGWALPNPRAIERALKPLKRDVGSRTESSLDAEATAQESAEQSYRNKLTVIPVFQPVPIPWLEVVLLVDNSSSMLIWQETAKELTQVLSRLGFRAVQVWHLETESKHIKILSTTTKRQTVSPERFLGDRNNCLLLILSDCVAPAWQEDDLIRLLAKWAKQMSVTILQVFPESLWSRTVLRNIDIQVTAYEPVISNTHFKIEPLSSFSSEESSSNKSDIPIPVVALEPDFLSDWAKMLTGTGYIYIPSTYTASLKLDRTYEDNSNVLEIKKTLDPLELVTSFQAFASPLAQKLAGLLASVPLTLPVIRLIQTSVLKEQSKLVHLAEVITSGLVYLLPESSTIIAKNQQVFEFHDGVRALLRRTVHTSETKNVWDAVESFINKKAGRGKSFAGFIPHLRGIETLDLDDQTLPFARLKAETLATLGPAYRSTVEKLQEQITQFERKRGILEVFDYTTPTVNRLGEIIQQETKRAQYFSENLGNNIILEMVVIPGGTFLMGSPETEAQRDDSESPQHEVTVPPFFMGKYPVTQAQWRAIAALPQINHELDPDPSHFKGDNLPVEQINWYQAVEFCDRLSKHTGQNYRLPSEAEWEYACRAGTTTPFHFGETITADLANYNAEETYADSPKGKYIGESTPVGSFNVANSFGLYDMHGNVWEWCADHWHDNYEGAPTDGSVWINEATELGENENDNQIKLWLIRGASWYYIPRYCRSACRDYPDSRDSFIGFRVVVSAART